MRSTTTAFGVSLLLWGLCLGLATACGSGGGGTAMPAATGGGTGSVSGGPSTGGAAGDTSGGGSFNSTPVFPAEPAKGTPGVWEEVTPQQAVQSPFGMGNVVADPVHPNELYVGGYGEIWKSTDYGLTWNKLDSQPNPPSLALGHVLAVAGTNPPTVYMANIRGPQFLFRSGDGGLTFTLTGSVPEEPAAQSFYSLEVDPNDPTHLLTGLHEEDRVLESTDSGDTWHFVSGAGWIPAISWFIYFIKTDDPATTRKTWFAIGQTGGSGMITHDAGKTWTVAPGLSKLEHPHGGGGILQNGNTLFVGGLYGADGDGVFRSTDLGGTFTRVTDGYSAVVWGSSKKVYTGWGWACAGCNGGTDGWLYKIADQPGDTWVKGTSPDRLNWGPNSIATTTDGTHAIYVGSMWATGLWRYVEP